MMTEITAVPDDPLPRTHLDTADRWAPWEVLPLSHEHRGLFERHLAMVGATLSDYSFAGNCCWQSHQHLFVALVEGCLCLFAARDDGLHMPLPPLGATADLPAATAACVALMERCNPARSAAAIYFATPAFIDAIRWGAPDLADRLHDVRLAGSDFIYRTADLVELRGVDYKSKRSDINQLLRAHPDARVEPLGVEHADAVRDLCLLWLRQRGIATEGRPPSMYGIEEELHAIVYAANNLDALGLVGARLIVDGELAGFTIGERLVTGDGNVLFEKTNLAIPGASQLLFREFCRTLLECPRITTGDGGGCESLARAKMSYRPIELADKFVLTFGRAP